MTITYEFTIGRHTEQAHEYTSALIDEAYKRKASAMPLPSFERVDKAEVLTEAYYAQVGLKPAESVLSRLAWYIVFDEMTDDHPDKMTREEYPILSEHQSSYRQRREKAISDIYTGVDDETIGRYKDGEGIKRRIYDYMTPKRDMSLLPAKYLDLYRAIDNAGLTERQRQAIDLVYFEGMTQEDAGKAIGLSRNSIDTHIRIGIEKIKKSFRKS